MKGLVRPAMLMGLVLLIPVVPFFFFGAPIAAWIDDWTGARANRSATAALIVALLSVDIFLPVPSSVVSTWGGQVLGTALATCASWLGMTAGAIFGFALARRWGYPFAKRFSGEAELERVERLCQLWGPVALVVARGVPVLAESSVLLVGIHKLAWTRFLWPVALTNAGIAFAYSGFGDLAARHGWLPLAFGVAIGLPVILLLVARRRFERS